LVPHIKNWDLLSSFPPTPQTHLTLSSPCWTTRRPTVLSKDGDSLYILLINVFQESEKSNGILYWQRLVIVKIKEFPPPKFGSHCFSLLYHNGIFRLSGTEGGVEVGARSSGLRSEQHNTNHNTLCATNRYTPALRSTRQLKQG